MRTCLSPGRKETGCSEWQVNWWDLRISRSGPDVGARRVGDGMPANPPLFPTRAAAGAAPRREEGPAQVSTSSVWLFLLQPQPHKGWVYFYWAEMASGMCSSFFLTSKTECFRTSFGNNWLISETTCKILTDIQSDQSRYPASCSLSVLRRVLKWMNVTNWLNLK